MRWLGMAMVVVPPFVLLVALVGWRDLLWITAGALGIVGWLTIAAMLIEG